MYKLIQQDSYHGYRQDDQNIPVLFSYVNKIDDTTVKQMFAPVNCREYFGDILFSEEKQTSVSIYGFNYNPKTQNIDRDKVRISLTYKAPREQNIKIIHDIEERYNLPKTVLIPTNIKGNYIAEGDPFWQSKGYLISLYTYLLKLQFIPILSLSDWVIELSKETGKEGRYLARITPEYFYKALDRLKEIGQVEKKPLSNVIGHDESNVHYAGEPSAVHHYHGFVNTFQRTGFKYQRTAYNRNFMKLIGNPYVD